MAGRPRVAISAGGSIVAPDDIDLVYLRELASVLAEVSADRDLLVVVGGGRISRRYISACRALGADEGYLDQVGIDATRLNARLLIAALGGVAHQGLPGTLDEALEAVRDSCIVVMGGTYPGHTTDAVCAMLAELAGAEEMLVLTNVDGVYTSDPKLDPGARRLERLTAGELMGIVGESHDRAGPSTIIDPLAARVMARAGIVTKVLDGRSLDQVRRALSGEDFEGTVVTPGDR